MTVKELEAKVWEQDGVRMIVRDRSKLKTKEYGQVKAAQGSWSIKRFIRNRIEPLVKDKEVVIIDGNGNIPHGKTLLKKVRKSYKGNGSQKA
jgi:hypothetical protein